MLTVQESKPTRTSKDQATGTKTGTCDICGKSREILPLSYGFNICEECLDICTMILKQLQTQQNCDHLTDKADIPKKTRPPQNEDHWRN